MHSKKNKRLHKPQPRPRGCAAAVDVVVGDKRKHAGLVSIENNGRDESGRIVGTNGIKWVTA